MNVCIVVPSLSGGGAEFVAREWARYLATQGDRVTLYRTDPKATDEVPTGVRCAPPAPHSALGRLLHLTAHLRRDDTEVVLALMPYWNLLALLSGVLLRDRRPAVAISGRNMVNALAPVFGRSYRSKQWLARRLYRRADLFVAISHPVAAEAAAEYGFTTGQVSVVPNPALAKVEATRPGAVHGAPGPAARPGSSGTSTLRPPHLDLVVPARLVAQKRPMVAVDVAALLGPQFPEGVRLHFFGVGPMQQAVGERALARSVDAVFHGWVPDWFDDCPPQAVLLLPSLSEGFGNVLVEAAAAGMHSVVSSRCLGSADAVVPGLTGQVVAGDSAEDYAAGVLVCAGRPIGEVGPWLARFSGLNSGRVLRSLLEQVVHARARSARR